MPALNDYRLTIAHANTNESIAAFALLALAAMLTAASPGWTNALLALWLGSRVLHMGFCYANMKPLRSAAFALSLIALLGLFLTTASRWV